MRKELEHFEIGNSYGGNQDWFRTFMMRIGGCGAETACDCSLYFRIHSDLENIYPYDLSLLSKHDYISFAHLMEQYLWPRMSGIDSPEIFIAGYSRYLSDRGVECLSMKPFSGSESYEKAEKALMRQIDAGFPVPTLILNHKDKEYRDYVWHWFIINGYNKPEGEGAEDTLYVKAVSYSSYRWLDFRRLWNTGYSQKGGLVLFDMK